MPFTPFTSPLQLVASTGPAGFALQNGTPTIVSWTLPNDGQIHAVQVITTLHVVATETGGACQWTLVDPLGTPKSSNIIAGGQVAGAYKNLDGGIAGAGTVVSIQQNGALTAGGPSTMYAEIWAT